MDSLQECFDLGAEGREKAERSDGERGVLLSVREELAIGFNGVGDFGVVDAVVAFGSLQAMELQSRGTRLEVLGFPHESERAMIEVLVGEANELGKGTEVLGEKDRARRGSCFLKGTVDERGPAEIEGLTLFPRKSVDSSKGGETVAGEEGKMTELLGVPSEESALSSQKDGEAGG